MKKIIIGIFILCFCSITNAATATYPTDGSYQEGGKPKGKWMGRLKNVGKVIAVKKAGKVVKYGVGGAIVGTGAVILGKKAYDYLSLRNYIARKIASEDPDSMIISHLTERITHDLNDSGKDRIDVMMKTKEELEYYIIRYANTKYSHRAIDVAINTGLYDSYYKQKLDEGAKDFSLILSKLKSTASDIERNNPNNCRQKSERDEIKNNNRPTDYTFIHNQTKIGDTGAYKDLTNRSKKDTNDNDHIPAKATVIQYIRNRDNAGIELDDPLEEKAIIKNASALNLPNDIHMKGRTYGDSTLQLTDSLDLAQTTMLDFACHLYNTGGASYVVVAFPRIYLRNYLLCLYE